MSIRAKKSWGQHFLHDKNVRRKIVHACQIEPDKIVVELGGGTGFLTEALEESGAVTHVVEMEERAYELLTRKFVDSKNIKVIQGDAVQLNLNHIPPKSKSKLVVGNLPYQAASPILFNLANQVVKVSLAIVMVQKEMALRMVAQEGGRARGAMGVNLQTVFDCYKLFDVAPGAFIPVPRVQSSVVSLTPVTHEFFVGVNLKEFRKFVQSVFSYRRKTMNNALKQTGVSAEKREQLKASFDLSQRPEQLSLESWADVFKGTRPT